MSWRSLFAQTNGLDHIERQLVEMLHLDQRSFELADQAMLRAKSADQLRSEISDTDHRVNELVQEVRRGLVIHAAVQDSVTDVPAMLAYMSIVKDIERIGDYAKNILDIARARAGHTEDELNDLAPHGATVHQLLRDVIVTFEQRDVARANQLIEQTLPVLPELDELVDALTISDRPGYHAVPRALYYRYLKRIAAHLLNILTVLTAPLDQLDFYRHGDAG